MYDLTKKIELASLFIFLFVSIILLVLFYVNIKILKRIEINFDGIKVKNFIPIFNSFYKWKEIGHSFETVEYGKSGSANVIYLFKNKKAVVRISDSVYQNYEDLKNEILKYLKIEDKN